VGRIAEESECMWSMGGGDIRRVKEGKVKSGKGEGKSREKGGKREGRAGGILCHWLLGPLSLGEDK